MAEVQIGGKTYSLGFTMLSVVRAKRLVGKGFFALASKETVGEEIDPEGAFDKVLALLLLGLQAAHGDEFKTIEDVAVILPDMGTVAVITPAINAELVKFLSVDENLQKQLADAKNAEGKDTKKKSRSTRSRKTNTPQSAESVSA